MANNLSEDPHYKALKGLKVVLARQDHKLQVIIDLLVSSQQAHTPPQQETQPILPKNMPNTIAELQSSWRSNRMDSFVSQSKSHWLPATKSRFDKRHYLMRYIRSRMAPGQSEEASAAAIDVERSQLDLSVVQFLAHLRGNGDAPTHGYWNRGYYRNSWYQWWGGRWHWNGGQYRHVPLAGLGTEHDMWGQSFYDLEDETMVFV